MQLLSRHLVEVDAEMAGLTALRAELVTMLAGMRAGPACPDPVPGTWYFAPETPFPTRNLCQEGGDNRCVPCCDDPTCECTCDDGYC